MNIINDGIKAWACSDYECDRNLHTCIQGKESVRVEQSYKLLSEIKPEYAISDEIYIEAKKASRLISLLDATSQVSKGALELALWPVFTALVIKRMNSTNSSDNLFPLFAVCYPPASVINRIRLIGIDLFGPFSPETAAVQRQNAFKSFNSGKSCLMYLNNLISQK